MNNASKMTPERLAKIDNYELPDHIEVDYSKVKPNRFAKHPHAIRNKKRSNETTEEHTITLYRDQVELLRTINPDLSLALREVIDRIVVQSLPKPMQK